MPKRGSWKAAVALFFLSPMIGELLSGSSPPLSFFTPFGLFFIAGLYGSGAIIIRETVRRWGQGWPSVLLLGAAYGILEEGIMVKSFFDPTWPDLGLLAVYGRWAGVNWVWAEWLTLYHSIYSITIPILLIEALFPSYRHDTYLGRKGLFFFVGLISFVVIFGHVFLTSYRLTFLELVGCAIAMAALISWARRTRHRRLGGPGGRIRTFWLWLLGTLSGFTYFVFVFNFLPSLGVPVLATMVTGLVFTGLIAGLVRIASRHGLSELNGLGLAAGFLNLLIFLDPILEISRTGAKNYTGQTMVGVAFVAFLISLARRVKRRETPVIQPDALQTEALPPPPPENNRVYVDDTHLM